MKLRLVTVTPVAAPFQRLCYIRLHHVIRVKSIYFKSSVKTSVWTSEFGLTFSCAHPRNKGLWRLWVGSSWTRLDWKYRSRGINPCSARAGWRYQNAFSAESGRSGGRHRGIVSMPLFPQGTVNAVLLLTAPVRRCNHSHFDAIKATVVHLSHHKDLGRITTEGRHRSIAPFLYCYFKIMSMDYPSTSVCTLVLDVPLSDFTGMRSIHLMILWRIPTYPLVNELLPDKTVQAENRRFATQLLVARRRLTAWERAETLSNRFTLSWLPWPASYQWCKPLR